MCDEKEWNGEYIRLAWKSTLEDIRFLKQQQWLLAYYTLLIYGGVIYVAQRLSPSFVMEIVIGIIIVVMVLSLWILRLLHRSTCEARERKNKVGAKAEKFTGPIEPGGESFWRDKECVCKRQKWGKWQDENLNFITLCLVIIMGFVLTFFVIMHSMCSNLFSGYH